MPNKDEFTWYHVLSLTAYVERKCDNYEHCDTEQYSQSYGSCIDACLPSTRSVQKYTYCNGDKMSCLQNDYWHIYIYELMALVSVNVYYTSFKQTSKDL